MSGLHCFRSSNEISNVVRVRPDSHVHLEDSTHALRAMADRQQREADLAILGRRLLDGWIHWSFGAYVRQQTLCKH